MSAYVTMKPHIAHAHCGISGKDSFACGVVVVTHLVSEMDSKKRDKITFGDLCHYRTLCVVSLHLFQLMADVVDDCV